VTYTAALRGLCFVILAVPLSGQCLTRYYRNMDINPASLTVQFSGEYSELPCGHVPTEPYFERSDLSTHTAVDRIVNGSRLGFFYLAPGFLNLPSRDKIQELFNGPRGPVFTTIHYHYDATYGWPQPISFQVRTSRSEIPHEPATVITTLPSDANQLNAISVIRACRPTSGETVPVATYTPDGNPLGVTVDLLVKGDWMSRGGYLDENVQKFGFPKRLFVAEYQSNPKWQSQVEDRLCYLTVVSFHYNHNRWVRQDVFAESGNEPAERQTRILRYKLTAQDASLEAVDRTFPWAGIDRRR
jgi:hypothetical protein